MPSLLAGRVPQRTLQQQINDAGQRAAVADAARPAYISQAGGGGGGGGGGASAGPKARSISDVLAQTADVDRSTGFLAKRTANFAQMGGMGGMGGGGSSLLMKRAAATQSLPGMSQQFTVPGSMLRRKSRPVASNNSGI